MTLNITDPEVIARLTNQAIPIDARQPIQVSSIEDEGTWQYDTVFYESVWPNGVSIPLVLRTYRSPITFWQTQDSNKLSREWAVLRRLRLDGFPAPRPVAHGEANAHSFIIWQAPAGQVWSDPAQAKPLIPHLADLLATLHTLDHNGLNNEPLYHATVAGSLVRMLLWSREMGNEDLRQAIARLKPAVAGLTSWPPRLLHGNPQLNNVIIEGGQITALVNWANAAIGDPRWDVMTAAHGLRQIEAEWGEQLVNWYETLTGQTIDKRPFWWAMVSVRLWALKGWTHHAVQSGLAPADFMHWAEDLAEAKTQAFDDLAAAGL